MDRDEKGRFVKDSIPWNKGLKHSNETREKMSFVKRGKQLYHKNDCGCAV